MIVKLNSADGVETIVSPGKEVAIGRDKKKCKIILPPDAEGVSRLHARVTLSAEGILMIADSSSFGTYVNGELVNQAQRSLVHGDNFKIGENLFTVSVKNPTSPGLMVKPVNLSQSTKKVTTKSKKAPVLNESQRKMSDFFKLSNKNTLAAETPYSQLCDKSAANSKSFVGDSIILQPSTATVIIDDDDDDFCVPKPSQQISRVNKTTLGSKKSSLLFSQPHKNATRFTSSNSSVSSTFDCLIKTEETLASDTMNYGSLVESYYPCKPEKVDDSQGVLMENELPEVPVFDIDDPVDLTTVMSQRGEFAANLTNTEIKKPKMGKKRSALFPMKMENPNPMQSAMTSTFLEPMAPPVKRKPVTVDIPETLEDSIRVSSARVPTISGTQVISDSMGSIFDMVEEKTVSRRGRKPIVEPKEEYDYKDFDFNSIAPNRDLLAAVYSGRKYEHEELEDEEKFKPNVKRVLDVEKVVKKLDKMIEFIDLTRSETSIIQSRNKTYSFNTTGASVSTCSGVTNFKKFHKASQGKFNNTRPSMCIVGGGMDLTDFRNLRG